MKFKDLLSGFVRLHVLHHAAEHEIYGQWMIDELARRGYKLSPGTLYPMLHAMERRGYLKSKRERAGRTFRLLYCATALGRAATTERPPRGEGPGARADGRNLGSWLAAEQGRRGLHELNVRSASPGSGGLTISTFDNLAATVPWVRRLSAQ